MLDNVTVLCYAMDVTLLHKGGGYLSELISKKELLEKYGISYGALYRWKRKGLIPESWFIRKSTYTGQETFFDRETICARIDEILRLRDSVPLDEMAELLEPRQRERTLTIIADGNATNFVGTDKIEKVIITQADGSETDITLQLLRLIDGKD